ncbi:MAG: UDP-3-O-(3-hydroxymyristoyl)glucosamine N-acyltransferase [Bacteroidetes bacterium]|nr:UDP-3-O-(3-hydroxymyristoyl)glucosamine N-acyltransferase [Bacteroidota bacterium]
MEFSANQIAQFLNGEVQGDPEIRVSNLSKIEQGEPGTLSFLANPKYTSYIYTTDASIVIVGKDFIPEQPVKATLVTVEDAYAAFAQLLEIYDQFRKSSKTGVSSLSFIHPTAKVADDVYVGEFVVIGANAIVGKGSKIYPQVYLGENVSIGEETTLNPGVKIYHNCVIGNRCTLHAGVAIGGDGFGFAQQQGADYKKVPQIGNVVIEDDVEIGSNTTIDRATLGSTFIRKGVKLDNLIQIAHNVEIGEHTVIAAQTGISGSTKIGKLCQIAGQVGLAGHLVIPDNVKIAAQSGVANSLAKDGSILMGSPAFEIGQYRKSAVGFKRLPDIMKRLDLLEKKLNELEGSH